MGTRRGWNASHLLLLKAKSRNVKKIRQLSRGDKKLKNNGALFAVQLPADFLIHLSVICLLKRIQDSASTSAQIKNGWRECHSANVCCLCRKKREGREGMNELMEWNEIITIGKVCEWRQCHFSSFLVLSNTSKPFQSPRDTLVNPRPSQKPSSFHVRGIVVHKPKATLEIFPRLFLPFFLLSSPNSLSNASGNYIQRSMKRWQGGERKKIGEGKMATQNAFTLN